MIVAIVPGTGEFTTLEVGNKAQPFAMAGT